MQDFFHFFDIFLFLSNLLTGEGVGAITTEDEELTVLHQLLALGCWLLAIGYYIIDDDSESVVGEMHDDRHPQATRPDEDIAEHRAHEHTRDETVKLHMYR